MATSKKDNTFVALDKEDLVTYKEKSYLMGLVKYTKRVVLDRIAVDLVVETDEKVRYIIFNGKRIKV